MVRAAGSIIEYGHSVALHDCIWSQCDGSKSAEEDQSRFLVLPGMTKGAGGAHYTPTRTAEAGFTTGGSDRTNPASGWHVSSDIKGLCRSLIVWLWSHQDNTILQAYTGNDVLYIMLI